MPSGHPAHSSTALRSLAVNGLRALTALPRGLTSVLCLAVLLLITSGVAQAEGPIWPRIAQGMRIVDPEHPETVIWARHYAERPVHFAEMLRRSEPFLWYIVEAVELRDMPLEIALLPAVESAFNPRARSSQRAQGLWQFVPQTGRAMGLRQTDNYDARLDAVASTRAALNYLNHLHDRFDDWLLALAAYNVGRGRLSSALAAAESPVFWDLELPRETREHVPRLLGVALLIKQPQRFGVKLPAIADRQGGQLVTLPRAVNLRSAAQQARVPISMIELYNPGLIDLGDTLGKVQVLLPPSEAGQLRQALRHGQHPPRPSPGVRTYVVAPGDSLWRIARRHHVTVNDLCRWNDLQRNAVLRPGRQLRIRPGEGWNPDNAERQLALG